MQAKKICVMGSYVTDLTARAPHLPVKGETVFGSIFDTGAGGKGCNQALAAKRAGGDVSLVTKVGRDYFGDFAITHFKKEGLYSPFVFQDDENATGAALIMLDDESSNSIMVVPGACTNITPQDIESCRGMLAGCGYLLTQLETNLDAAHSMIRLARELNVPVILNTAPAQPLTDEMLAMVDVVTPNEVEAAILTGMKVETADDCQKAANWFFSKGVKQVIITLGSNGVYCNDGNTGRLLPVLPTTVVDTTGAGDAFNGGFVAALAEGQDFFDACAFGSVTAGLAVSRFGTAKAMPVRAEIDEAMTRYHALI